MQPLLRGDRDLGRVVPVFIPASFVETCGWPGPYEALPARGIALAWAAPVGDTAAYVLEATQHEWESKGIDWRARALENLRQLSMDCLSAGALFRENGETWLISLVDSDGLGPSRLLLTEKMERIFPDGYRVALPERTRAFAFRSDLDGEERDIVESLIEKAYRSSERALVTSIFEPCDLLTTASYAVRRRAQDFAHTPSNTR